MLRLGLLQRIGDAEKRKRPVLFPGRVSSCVSLAHVAMIACIAFTPNELVKRPMEAPLETTRSYQAAIMPLDARLQRRLRVHR
jgi:hypothetical protein